MHSIVPPLPRRNGLGYWCSWGTQNYGPWTSTRPEPSRVITGSQAFEQATENLRSESVFGPRSWSAQLPAAVRSGLRLLLDVGWDLPSGTRWPEQKYLIGAAVPDPGRFPLPGDAPQRLAGIEHAARENGWRGVALWISPQVPGADWDHVVTDPAAAEDYWSERARWCAWAGIGYWKVDIGAASGSVAFRRMLTEVARREAPELVVEHGRNCGPLNGYEMPWEPMPVDETGRFAEWGPVLEEALQIADGAQVLRTYDVLPQLSAPTTLDRVAELLLDPRTRGTVLNAEDELYLAASLGCSVGVMRHPSWGYGDGDHHDPHAARSRVREIERAVRWQRLAAPEDLRGYPVTVSRERLEDRWAFEPGDSWADFFDGRTVRQSAPAVVARGLALPEVAAGSPVTFVTAGKWPSGCAAVAALPRAEDVRRLADPEVAVLVREVADCDTFGLFGPFAEVVLDVDPRGRSVWAQDLAEDAPRDVTDRVVEPGSGRLRIDRSLIAELTVQPADDPSAPGIVVQLR